MATPSVNEAVALANKILPPFDTESCDAKTLTVLLGLLIHEQPRVIVEAGTYNGHFAIQGGGILKAYNYSGRIWTADPVDHGVAQRIADAELLGRVYYHGGPFEELLDICPAPIDFAFIDATESGGDPAMRLKHVTAVLPLMRPGGLVCVDDTASDWTGVEVLRRMGLSLGGARGLTVIRV